MVVTLGSVLTKQVLEPVAAQGTLSYPDLVALFERMKAQDGRIIFDSLRPIGDEFWNLINGRRSVAQIADEICLQFGFELDPEHFLPMAEGLVRKELAGLKTLGGGGAV
jgi:hypothetical protein